MSSNCILCGKCVSVCPLINATNREELGPRAKADLCRLLSDDAVALSEQGVAKLAAHCLGCHRCASVCSQGVDVPGLVAALRSEHPDFKGWLWKTWLTRAKELWSVSSTAAALIPETLQPRKFGPFLKMLAGLKGESGISPMLKPDVFPDTCRGEKVLLFAGCTANYVQGRWLMAALRLLDGVGVEVLPADFQCCGSSLKGAGFTGEGEQMARQNIDIWREAGKPRIVTFCASCHAGLGAYGFDDRAEQKAWQQALTPLSGIALDTSFVIIDNSPEKIGYHRPCHASEVDADRAFLSQALGERLSVATGNECCGFGGVMRLGAPDLSEQVNTQCWEALGKANVVVTGCSACAAQLSATAPQGAVAGHWLELIA